MSDSELIATLTALRDRLRERHLHGADALDTAIERLAVIQRVRELCDAKTQEVAASDPLFGPPWALYVDDILRALDGAE